MMFARVVVGAMMPCLAGCEGPGLVKCPARQDVETHFVAMVTEGDEYMDAALESKMPMLSFGPPATLSDALDFFEDCALNCLCKNGHDGKGRIRVVACVGKELLERPVPTIRTEQISVKEALQLLCESAGCRFKVDSSKRTVTVIEERVGDNELEAKGK